MTLFGPHSSLGRHLLLSSRWNRQDSIRAGGLLSRPLPSTSAEGPKKHCTSLEVRQPGNQTGPVRSHVLQPARARLLPPTGLAVSGKALPYTLSAQVVLQTPAFAESSPSQGLGENFQQSACEARQVSRCPPAPSNRHSELLMPDLSHLVHSHLLSSLLALAPDTVTG